MSGLICHQFPYLSDNYGVLVHCPVHKKTVAIDAGDAQPYLDALDKTGYKLDEIWITHHHWDHTDGLAVLKEKTGALVRGPANTKAEIAALIDAPVQHGDIIHFADTAFQVIATPGHTLDMINFYSPQNALLFTGDTLFVLGCGRLFEGDGRMMWQSLSRFADIPPQTVIYSAHEYSLANAAFALSIEPENKALQARAKQIKDKRETGLPTVPSTMAEERETNPFLRPHSAEIRQGFDMIDASDEDVFVEIRRRKDNF